MNRYLANNEWAVGLLAQATSGIPVVDNIINNLLTIGQALAGALAVVAFVFACIRGAAGVASGSGGSIAQAVSAGLGAFILAGLALSAQEIYDLVIA